MSLLFDRTDDADERAGVLPADGLIRIVRAANRWRQARRAERARRLALANLMEMDPHRLDDLGISLQDVREALGKQ